MREVLEWLIDGTEDALIKLDLSKAFDWVDHQFLVTVLETPRFQPEFHKWIRMMSPFYVLTLEPLLRNLWDWEASLSLRGIFFDGPLSAKVSAYADDISVSRRLDIEAMKKAVMRYKK